MNDTVIKLENGDWITGQMADGSYKIVDANGTNRGRWKDAENLVIHLAMALSNNDRLQRELAAVHAELREATQ